MMDLFQNEIETIAIGKSARDGTQAMKNFHYHNGYEIYYLVKGNRNYVIDDEYFTLSKGDIVLIKPGILHKTAGGAFERLLVNFTEKYLERFFTPEASSILLQCFEDKIINIPSEYRLQVRDLLEKMYNLLENGNEELSFIYLADFLNLLQEIRISKQVIVENTEENSKMITNILHYINKHFDEIDNITQIADKFFITKYHLCRSFKFATNISVIEYLNRVKIKKACSLLENTKKSITEICTDCGFNSSVYFCKLFKKLMNMTPSEYREQIADYNQGIGTHYVMEVRDGKVTSAWDVNSTYTESLIQVKDNEKKVSLRELYKNE